MVIVGGLLPDHDSENDEVVPVTVDDYLPVVPEAEVTAVPEVTVDDSLQDSLPVVPAEVTVDETVWEPWPPLGFSGFQHEPSRSPSPQSPPAPPPSPATQASDGEGVQGPPPPPSVARERSRSPSLGAWCDV